MIRAAFLVGIFVVLLPGKTMAIEDLVTNVPVYNQAAPTNNQVPNWNSGWTQPSVQPTGYTYTTGWNYVGTVNGDSAVYLGYGEVLTAAHVGAADFVLNGVTYPMVAGSAQVLNSVVVPGQSAPVTPAADLVIFQVSPAPALPPLAIRSSDPKQGNQIVMIGYGHANGDRSETWGANTVTYTNEAIALTNNGSAYYSNDMLTLTQNGTGNLYQLVMGDSGGGDFIYNTTTKAWELAGLNEAVVTDAQSRSYSALVQLNTYAPQINTAFPAAASPTLPPWGMVVLAHSLLVAAMRLRPNAHLPSKASSKG